MSSANNQHRYEEFVRRNRVFVLGAGFSAAAGVPLTGPLLSTAMKRFSSECPGIFSRVDNYAKQMGGLTAEKVDYSQISLSELCTFLEYIELREYGGGERWSDGGCREKLALRFYLSATLVEHTPPGDQVPALYLEFARQLHESDIVISFNWDCLLEVALGQVGKKYSYNPIVDWPQNPAQANSPIQLYKLHGSVNWRLGEPKEFGAPANTLGWEPLGFASGLAPREIYATPRLLDRCTWRSYAPLGEAEPFLVLPGYGKAFDVRSNARLWYKPGLAFSTTHDVFIVGLSLAPDDFFIRSFFLSTLPYISSVSGLKGRGIYIINPAPDAASNYNFVLSGGNAQLIQEPFSRDHVSLMKERLGNV